MREFVLLLLRAEAQFIDVLDNLAQVVTALNLVFDLAENLADLVFDCVRAGRSLLEPMQIGKESLIDKVSEVVADHRSVVVQLAVSSLRRRPAFPAILLLENVFVFLSVQRGFVGLILLKTVEI